MARPPEFSFRTRRKNLERLANETFDLLIIGGGITGAGIARDATLRGLSVALVDRRDFAVGTSSRSSKMIHGGLRYLEHGDVGLVMEAANERASCAAWRRTWCARSKSSSRSIAAQVMPRSAPDCGPSTAWREF
jgi:L-2-hydroxyglutarate oxidase LhgO